MNHLDEGTIHAWLDGAVETTQAREIEAHVATCAGCSAAVAEARGLIAGSSRILAALDEVPAGVIPKRASPPAPAAPRRQWRAARWVTGIAALFLGAVVLRTATLTQGGMDSLGERRATPRAMMADTATSASGLASTVGITAAASGKSPTALPESPRQVAKTAGPGRQRESAVSQRAEIQPSAGADSRSQLRRETGASVAAGIVIGGMSAAAGNIAAEKSSAAVNVTTEPAPAANTGAASAMSPRAARDEAVRAKAGAVPAAPITAPTVARGRLLSLNARQGATLVELHAGCYRIDVPEERSRMPATLGEVARRAAGRAAQPQTQTAAAPSAARMDYAGPPPPAIVRLDTATAALGFAVTVPATDSVIGSWRVLRDSARVDLLARGVFTFATTDKTECPER